ncbi:hypothetical protein EJ04DRAFT_609222 [Polyplosphaeria fusca]|uniref:Uncharacterized protein n=1 Tax=Polyplosphaeria fusca TaxID=682080 RepID=A0A9P4R5E5_9PLEO|nr:hypothetical protein EJ04DRAFT_609222 [Polyplosphaeria fusca]
MQVTITGRVILEDLPLCYVPDRGHGSFASSLACKDDSNFPLGHHTVHDNPASFTHVNAALPLYEDREKPENPGRQIAVQLVQPSPNSYLWCTRREKAQHTLDRFRMAHMMAACILKAGRLGRPKRHPRPIAALGSDTATVQFLGEEFDDSDSSRIATSKQLCVRVARFWNLLLGRALVPLWYPFVTSSVAQDCVKTQAHTRSSYCLSRRRQRNQAQRLRNTAEKIPSSSFRKCAFATRYSYHQHEALSIGMHSLDAARRGPLLFGPRTFAPAPVNACGIACCDLSPSALHLLLRYLVASSLQGA